jgi:hypothetical protein
MMVLHGAHIIVQQGQGVTGLDQEVVVYSPVLVVVDDCRQIAYEKLGACERFKLKGGPWRGRREDVWLTTTSST